MLPEFLSIWREYMWSEFNVWPKSPKISNVNKTDVFQLNLSWLNRKLGWQFYWASFSSVWHPWRHWLSKGFVKQNLSDIQVSTFLGVNDSQNIKLWSWSFLSKCAKFFVDCKNAIKSWGNCFDFWDNGVWRCCSNFSQLWQEYIWSAVHVLRTRPMISDLIKRDVF